MILNELFGEYLVKIGEFFYLILYAVSECT
jgi:hypothetical protein